MGDTLLQFGGALANVVDVAEPHGARSCPVCEQHFSSADARFCPFDGEPLVDAQDYDPAADPLLGSIVDNRYEVQRVLGEGGMGTVYRVKHVALGKAFALKALRADLASDAEIAERFIGEARTAAAVSHPGLVQITDFGKLPEGRPYFVMELLEGYPLSAFIRRDGALAPARVLSIVRQIAEAVSAAHHADIVHRDLKPDNVHVMVSKDGGELIKVLDFGLAKVMGGSRRTREGVVFGTPHYMSPEQAAGEPVDHRADIYALGVVMYELITGRVPFEADSFMGVLSKHIYMAPPPPSQVIKSVHGAGVGALEGIVLKCLEKKPKQRYQSLDELLADLAEVADGEQIGRLSQVPRQKPIAGPAAQRAATSAAPGDERALPLASLWPVLGVGGLLLLMVVGFLLVRGTGAAGRRTPPTASVRPVAVAVAPPVPRPATSVAEPKASAPPRVEPAPPRPERGAPRRQPATPPAPVKSEPAAARAPAPARPRSALRGEIVDPWAQ